MSRGAEAVDAIECRGCRHWRPFVTQWGHCGCEMVRRHVDGEAPLVTRGSFSCRFHAPAGASAGRPKPSASDDELRPHLFAATE